MNNYCVSGVLVHATPRNINAVRENLLELPGLEIHEISESGQIVVTLEGTEQSTMHEGMEKITGTEGVLSASLVFNFNDDVHTIDMEIPIQNLWQEIALDAVQTPVDRCIWVSLGGNNFAVLGAYQNTAACTAITARCLVPSDFVAIACFCQYCIRPRYGDSGRSCSRYNCVTFQELTSADAHDGWKTD